MGTHAAAAPLVRLGLIEFPPELESLLRYGRGVDTTRLGKAGFSCRYTTAGAVDSFIRAVRLRRSVGDESTRGDDDVASLVRRSRRNIVLWSEVTFSEARHRTHEHPKQR